MPNKFSNQGALDLFFGTLKSMEKAFILYTERKPERLLIRPKLLQDLSKVDGFYQRTELSAEVTQYAPVVRYFKLNDSVVFIQEDYDEPFMHFE